MATSKIAVTEGSGVNLATYSISEDAVTKQVSRTTIATSDGTEAGTAASPLQVSLANTAANSTAVKVDGSAVTQPVSGTVTANAGTNLNTSTLALEAGGNLASIKTNTDKIPALGQALAASCVPVVLPAAQITTLTPPAAITGFATEATLGTVHGHVDSIDTKTPALGQAAMAASVPVAIASNQSGVPVTGTFWQTTQPISGTVTANAGTNLNTSALALETGGNLAAVKTNTDKIPALGQAAMAASVPVALASNQSAIPVNATLGAETTKVIGTINVAASQSIGVTQATAANLNAQVVGSIAHDSADSGNPVKTGGRAVNAEITAVAANDRVDFVADLTGKQIVMPYANPENFISGATSDITGTTATSVIAAAGAGIRNYITNILVTNSHATVGTFVNITDGSGGTILYTGYAAALGGGFSVTLPVPIKTTANTALFCACATTGSNVRVCASGYKGA